MPIYAIKNKETGEIIEKMMSISAWETYKIEHPNEEQHFSSMNFIDEVRLGKKRPDNGWFDVMDRIKQANPLHNMSSRWERKKEW